MPDPFYKSSLWKQLRARVIRRSRGWCEAPGCTLRGVIVDHIKSRRAGGPDHESNLRHLCKAHDNAVKENERGERRHGGKLPSGCDASGLPVDPTHPFFGGQSSQFETNDCQAGSNITDQCEKDRRGSRANS
jgi:5-methylcytosine-specific restriction enzyme A